MTNKVACIVYGARHVSVFHPLALVSSQSSSYTVRTAAGATAASHTLHVNVCIINAAEFHHPVIVILATCFRCDDMSTNNRFDADLVPSV